MLQQIKKTTITMNTYPTQDISEHEFMMRNFNDFPNLITENDCKKALIYSIDNVVYIPERFQTQEMWNLYVKSKYFRITLIPIKFQTQEMWNEALKEKYILNHPLYGLDYLYRTHGIEYYCPSEFITKNTIDIVREFCISEYKMYYIKYFSDCIWKKRRAFCIIINKSGFQTKTKLNLDVLKLVVSFI